jgi:hypothetical protein
MGSIWNNALLTDDPGTASGFSLLYFIGVVAFLWLSYIVLANDFKRRWNKRIFALWVVLQLFGFMLSFSYLCGVADTVKDFPLVSFSDDQHLLSDGALPILLGSDDKQFALLIVYSKPNADGVKRLILYLPRTEVKWMTELRLVPLQPMAKANELPD